MDEPNVSPATLAKLADATRHDIVEVYGLRALFKDLFVELPDNPTEMQFRKAVSEATTAAAVIRFWYLRRNDEPGPWQDRAAQFLDRVTELQTRMTEMVNERQAEATEKASVELALRAVTREALDWQRAAEQARAEVNELLDRTRELEKIVEAAGFVIDCARDLGRCAVCNGLVHLKERPAGGCDEDCPGRELREALEKAKRAT